MNRRQRLRRTRLRHLAVFGPVGFAVMLWAIGLSLPSRHSEEVRTVVGVSAETVWAVLTDLDGMPDWRRDIRGLERLPDLDGRVRWVEVRAAGRSTLYERVEFDSPRRLVVESSSPRRRWVYEIRSLDRGSELAVREERSIENPMVRTMVSVFGDRGRLEQLKTDLDRRFAGRRELLASRSSP